MTTSSALLLQSTLDQINANPTDSYWYRLLVQQVNEADQADLVSFVVSELARQNDLLSDPLPRFLHEQCLAVVTGQRAYLQKAAQALLSEIPVSPERLNAYLLNEWAWTLQIPLGRLGFLERINEAGLPLIGHRLGQHLVDKLNPSPARSPCERVTRVALVTPYLGGATHTPTSMVMQQARLLLDQGVEVALFAAQEQKIPRMGAYLSVEAELVLPEADTAYFRECLPECRIVMVSDERFSLMRRWTELHPYLNHFLPDVVFFIGFYSPWVHALYEGYPVVSLNINSTQALVPADVWLCGEANEQGCQPGIWAPTLPAATGVFHPYRVLRKKAVAELSRETANIKPGAFVLVTLGFRLATEIMGSWAQKMVQWMRAHPSAIWILVGGVGTIPPALGELADDQLQVLPQQVNIRGLFGVCDVYLNPPRMGGGFSVAEAMAEALPVLAFAQSDGGNKLGEHAVPDESAYFQTLDALYQSPELRKQMGQELKHKFEQNLNLANSGPPLLAACQRAKDLYEKRSTPLR